jgi:hypothetical protein
VTPEYLRGGPVDVFAANATLGRRSHDIVWGLPLDAGPPWTLVQQELGFPGDLISQGFEESVPIFQQEALGGHEFVKIDTLTCLQHYTALFGNHSDILLVSSEITDKNKSNNSFLAAGSFNEGPALPEIIGYWMCGNSNSFSCRDKTDWNSSLIANWNVYGYKIDYCLERQIDLNDRCSVHFSLPIMTCISALLVLSSDAQLTRISYMHCKPLQMYGYYLHRRILRKKQKPTTVDYRYCMCIFPEVARYLYTRNEYLREDRFRSTWLALGLDGK